MKITLTGSLGNISKPLAQQLVKAGHEVTVISSKVDKVADIEALGAKAAIGSVDDVAFLTAAFAGADAIYTMVPPNFGAPNYRAYIGGIGKKYVEAIKNANVKRVVNLSSIGADLPEGTGPIEGLYDVEHSFSELDGVAVKHLRAAFFYTNFYGNVNMIKHLGFLGNNYGKNDKIVMVHPEDIATAAAEELQQGFEGKTVRYVASDIRTGAEAAHVLGAAIGKPELNWVEFDDQQAYEGMVQAGLPTEIARNFRDMGTSLRTGKLLKDYFVQKPTLSATKLESFAKEFAHAF